MASHWTASAWEPSPVRPFDRIDLYIAVGVFVVASIAAALYLPTFRAGGGRAEFYQEEFTPAVMSACGRGFTAIATPLPALQRFLERGTNTFDCRELPANVPLGSLSTMQGAFRYLMTSVALLWRITGVSWTAIDVLLAALFATGLTAGYVALRFVSGRTLAILGTLLWLTSPMHLGNLPHLRDYSKAPFFLLTLVGVAFAIREHRGWALALAGVVFGVVQGFGFGMRTDVILNLVPFLLALFAAGSRGLREALPVKIVTALLTCAAFTLVAWPILTAYGESEGVTKVALLGLTTPFDERLSVREGPYDFGTFYNDSFVSAEVRADWERSHHGESAATPVPFARAARDYYIKLATTFPGDFATRMTGAMIQTLNLPFTVAYGAWPSGVTNRVLTALGSWRTQLMLVFIGCGPLVALALLVFAGLTRLRDAAVGFLLLIFWTAYPFIQFHPRHTFHLEFLVIAGFMALLSLAGRSFRQVRQGSWPSLRCVLQAKGLVIGMVAAGIVVLLALRGVQSLQAERLFDQYQQARTDDLPSAATLFEPREAASPAFRIQQAFIVVDVARTGCAKPPDVVTFRYPPDPDTDFTQEVAVPQKPVRIFAPVYGIDSPRTGGARFSGVDVAPESAACVRVSKVRGLDQVLWIDARLTPDWRKSALYQRLYIGPAFPERLWLKLAQWWPGISNLG
ncbi:MAG TPA: hypothetical protein VN628_01610 [Vicinamibacterales bacterium]|nr:hypothetical protein [Vicinamibacterales bacterium]